MSDPAVSIHQHIPATFPAQPAPAPQQVEQIANVPSPVTAFGRTYQIKRFSLYQFACSLNYITPLSALLQTLARSSSSKSSQSLTQPEYDELMNGWLAAAPPALRASVARNLAPQPQMDRTEWIPAIVGALSMSGDSMMGLISVATYEPVEWLQHEDRDPFDGIELLFAIVEKNLDFFSEKNIKRLTAIVEQLTPKINALYGAASAISSTTDTTT